MTDYRATQVAVEEWASIIPPQTQLTQVAVEMWAAVPAVMVQMTATQVAVEQWASVLTAAGGAAQARTMVMA